MRGLAQKSHEQGHRYEYEYEYESPYGPLKRLSSLQTLRL